MSISAYTGLPGHGKSYGVVSNAIVPALKQGRRVWTNIPMHEDALIEYTGSTVTSFAVQDIVDNPRWFQDVFESGALIVIDEVWRLWPAGLKANNMNELHSSFFAEHRHMVGEDGYSTEIIIVTQGLNQIASSIRGLVENTYLVHKAVNLGLSKKFAVEVYYGPVTGVTPPKSKIVNTIHGVFKKEIYALYQSHTMSKSGAGNEKQADGRNNYLKSGNFMFLIFGIVFFGFLTVWMGKLGFSMMFGGSQESELNEPVPVFNESLDHDEALADSLESDDQPYVDNFSFLSLAEDIYIVWNNGIFPKISYKFKVVFDNYESNLSMADLYALNYEVKPINHCLVRISGADFNSVAMCQRSLENPTITDPNTENGY